MGPRSEGRAVAGRVRSTAGRQHAGGGLAASQPRTLLARLHLHPPHACAIPCYYPQVATYALVSMEKAMARDGIITNDRQLACARINSQARGAGGWGPGGGGAAAACRMRSGCATGACLAAAQRAGQAAHAHARFRLTPNPSSLPSLPSLLTHSCTSAHPPPQAGGPGLPDRHGLRRQLRLGQPLLHDVPVPPGGAPPPLPLTPVGCRPAALPISHLVPPLGERVRPMPQAAQRRAAC